MEVTTTMLTIEPQPGDDYAAGYGAGGGPGGYGGYRAPGAGNNEVGKPVTCKFNLLRRTLPLDFDKGTREWCAKP